LRWSRFQNSSVRSLPFEPPDPPVVAEAADGIAVGRWPRERPRQVAAAYGELHGRSAPAKRSENNKPLLHRPHCRQPPPSLPATLKLYSTGWRRYDSLPPSVTSSQPPSHSQSRSPCPIPTSPASLSPISLADEIGQSCGWRRMNTSGNRIEGFRDWIHGLEGGGRCVPPGERNLAGPQCRTAMDAVWACR
jgi:hypothetical protein